MTTFSEQFPIVFQALNIGFVQTLKLFFVTLIGAIPLGLIISFGSMSNWAPLGFLRPLLKNLPKNTKLTWWQRFQIWCYVDFKPIRIIVRFIIWVVRGTPLMLQLLVFYYFPGLVLGKNIWGGGEAGRFLASSIAFIFNYACYFSEIFRGGIQSLTALLIPLFTSAFRHAETLSAAMEARCYHGGVGTTRLDPLRLTWRDAVGTGALVLMIAAVIATNYVPLSF